MNWMTERTMDIHGGMSSTVPLLPSERTLSFSAFHYQRSERRRLQRT
jgi:hypothetical protein